MLERCFERLNGQSRGGGSEDDPHAATTFPHFKDPREGEITSVDHAISAHAYPVLAWDVCRTRTSRQRQFCSRAPAYAQLEDEVVSHLGIANEVGRHLQNLPELAIPPFDGLWG